MKCNINIIFNSKNKLTETGDTRESQMKIKLSC